MLWRCPGRPASGPDPHDPLRASSSSKIALRFNSAHSGRTTTSGLASSACFRFEPSESQKASWVDFPARKQAHTPPATTTRHGPSESPATAEGKSRLWLKNQARKPSHKPAQGRGISTNDSGGTASCGPTTTVTPSGGSGRKLRAVDIRPIQISLPNDGVLEKGVVDDHEEEPSWREIPPRRSEGCHGMERPSVRRPAHGFPDPQVVGRSPNRLEVSARNTR